MMGEVPQDIIEVETFQTILLSHATHASCQENHRYPELRRKFLANPELRKRLPDFVQKYTDLGGFWQFIKRKFDNYAERREYIYDALAPLISYVESKSGNRAPVDALAAEALDLRPDFERVRAAWQKTIDRRDSAPTARSPVRERSWKRS